MNLENDHNTNSISHLVLYKGTEIIMAAKLKWIDGIVTILFLDSYDEDHFKKYEIFLKNFIYKWSKKKQLIY